MNLLTLTGPSCSGKTTLLNRLVFDFDFYGVTSHTTRPKRPGEIEGVDYFFIETEEFNSLKDNNRFIENISFSDYQYGVSVGELLRAQAAKKTSVLIVEPEGLKQIISYSKNNSINLSSIYINGDQRELIKRYLIRLVGENLNDPEVCTRHAKRILSLSKEFKNWAPNINNIGSGDILYQLVLDRIDETNTEIVIRLIKEIEKKLWLK
jgi:guanylate kinase